MGHLSHEWTYSPAILLCCSRKEREGELMSKSYREQVSAHNDLHHQWNGLRSGSSSRLHGGIGWLISCRHHGSRQTSSRPKV